MSDSKIGGESTQDGRCLSRHVLSMSDSKIGGESTQDGRCLSRNVLSMSDGTSSCGVG